MGKVIELEQNWHEMALQRRLVPEGEYVAAVESVEPDECTAVKAVFRISQDGHHQGRYLHEKFNLEGYAAKFYEFLHATGLDPAVRQVDLQSLAGASVRVTVKHRKDDEGTFWANITRYAAV